MPQLSPGSKGLALGVLVAVIPLLTPLLFTPSHFSSERSASSAPQPEPVDVESTKEVPRHRPTSLTDPPEASAGAEAEGLDLTSLLHVERELTAIIEGDRPLQTHGRRPEVEGWKPPAFLRGKHLLAVALLDEHDGANQLAQGLIDPSLHGGQRLEALRLIPRVLPRLLGNADCSKTQQAAELKDALFVFAISGESNHVRSAALWCLSHMDPARALEAFRRMAPTTESWSIERVDSCLSEVTIPDPSNVAVQALLSAIVSAVGAPNSSHYLRMIVLRDFCPKLWSAGPRAVIAIQPGLAQLSPPLLLTVLESLSEAMNWVGIALVAEVVARHPDVYATLLPRLQATAPEYDGQPPISVLDHVASDGSALLVFELAALARDTTLVGSPRGQTMLSELLQSPHLGISNRALQILDTAPDLWIMAVYDSLLELQSSRSASERAVIGRLLDRL